MADSGPDLPPSTGGAHRSTPEKYLTTKDAETLAGQPASKSADLGGRLTEVEERLMRLGRDVLVVAAGLLVVLILCVVIGLWVNAQQAALHRLDARHLGGDVEQLRVTLLHRDALCRSHLLTLGGQSPDARADYAAGEVAYDRAYAELRTSAVHLGCVPE